MLNAVFVSKIVPLSEVIL